MKKHRYINSCSVLQLVRILILGIAIYVPAIAVAGDSFSIQASFENLKDGDILLTPIGQRGAGVYMSFHTPDQNPEKFLTIDEDQALRLNTAAAEVHLSVVFPW